MRPVAVLAVVLTIAGRAAADPTTGDPPEVLLGNRLFDETRFAQFFAAHAAADVNAPFATGDPMMDVTATTGAPLPGPFAGQAVNCRACHMDVEQKGVAGGGNRAYADFARRSPIPDRGDGETTTVRNSQQLLNASLTRPGPFFLHLDGEFPAARDLVKATLTGRNFGWLPEEQAAAVAHVARVIREDDGRGALAASFGGATYAGAFRGTDPLFPTNRPVPTALALDVMHASDDAVLDAIGGFIAAYLESLVDAKAVQRSPYDEFLARNGLPAAPRRRESDVRYSRRLAKLVDRLAAPRYVTEADGHLVLHAQPFVFGETELAGLRLFLRAARGRRASPGTGNCVACHPAPTFTDFAFHDTGAAQEEYDAVHGAGAFVALTIPDLATRNADPDAYLPPSPAHPRAASPFRAVPSAERPGRTDLGLWNSLQNPSFSNQEQQRAIVDVVCRSIEPRTCTGRRRRPAALLDAAVALFKTPSLRDLGHSAPYLHTGRMDTLEDVVAFYRAMSERARHGKVRNGASALAGIVLRDTDAAPLVAFLRALNEDFE
jgi:cytochrome c peroxidase